MKRILAGLALAVLAIPACAEVVVIVNPKNPAASMTPEQVAQVFLGRSNSFPGGGAATPERTSRPHNVVSDCRASGSDGSSASRV